MGSTVETVVNTPLLVFTRSPTCACAIPAMPSIGETMRVNPRWSSAGEKRPLFPHPVLRFENGFNLHLLFLLHMFGRMFSAKSYLTWRTMPLMLCRRTISAASNALELGRSAFGE